MVISQSTSNSVEAHFVRKLETQLFLASKLHRKMDHIKQFSSSRTLAIVLLLQ
jgi:hypothetical protein